MMSRKCVLFLVSIVCISCTQTQLPKARFEYKYSFKGPHLVQRDSSVPFWEYIGDSMAGDDGIRLTPSLRSKRGSVWSKNTFSSPDWQLDVGVRITGRGRIGADGMAIWFTEERGTVGSVFGSPSQWKGLGVFLDSFDNDNLKNNPYIMAVVNDGSKTFDHLSDGSNQQVGGCLRDFRNKQLPVLVRIEYYKRTLTVTINNGQPDRSENFELCLRSENVFLPPSGFLGVSAATGGIADDHDVLHFLTHSLHVPGSDAAQVSEEDRMKFEAEFQEYFKDLERAKRDYRQDRLGQKTDSYSVDDADVFESESQRDTRQLTEGQLQIHSSVREVGHRLDEILGRQELLLTKVGSLTDAGQAVRPQAGQQTSVDAVKRHEVDRLLNSQSELMQHVRDLRLVLSDIQTRTTALHTSSAGAIGAGGSRGIIDQQTDMHEIRDRLEAVGGDVTRLVNRRPPANVPDCPSCLTPTMFLVCVAVHITAVVGYLIYRRNMQDSAKKFY